MWYMRNIFNLRALVCVLIAAMSMPYSFGAGSSNQHDQDVLAGVLRDVQLCTAPQTIALAKKTSRELATRLNKRSLEKLQLLHAACGEHLQKNAPEEYAEFTKQPDWATTLQWRAMIADDQVYAFFVKTLRSHAMTPEKLCSFAGWLGRYLEYVTGHDIVRSVLCYLCENAFIQSNDPRAREAVCSVSFADAIASLLKEEDCMHIARFGRVLKTLPGPLKNRAARMCELYFLGLDPLTKKVEHPQAWAAVNYKLPEDATIKRDDLLGKEKSLPFFGADDEE